MENIGAAGPANAFKGSLGGNLGATTDRKPLVQNALHSISSLIKAWVDRPTKQQSAYRVRQDIDKLLPFVEPYTGTVTILDLRLNGTSANEAMKAISAKMPSCSVIVLTEQSMNDPGGVGFQDYAGTRARKFDLPLAKIGEQFGASEKQRAALLSDWHPGGQGFAILTPTGQVGHRSSSFRPRQLTLGNLRINLQAHEVHIGSKPVHLTLTEFRLLVALAMHLGEVLDYASLVRQCLGYEAELLEAKELIKRHICALRRKIEPSPANPRYIINIRGVGYRMAMPQGD